jgi:hypothetical protein
LAEKILQVCERIVHLLHHTLREDR